MLFAGFVCSVLGLPSGFFWIFLATTALVPLPFHFQHNIAGIYLLGSYVLGNYLPGNLLVCAISADTHSRLLRIGI